MKGLKLCIGAGEDDSRIQAMSNPHNSISDVPADEIAQVALIPRFLILPGISPDVGRTQAMLKMHVGPSNLASTASCARHHFAAQQTVSV
jgi:hypothetical protein